MDFATSFISLIFSCSILSINSLIDLNYEIDFYRSVFSETNDHLYNKNIVKSLIPCNQSSLFNKTRPNSTKTNLTYDHSCIITFKTGK